MGFANPAPRCGGRSESEWYAAAYYDTDLPCAFQHGDGLNPGLPSNRSAAIWYGGRATYAGDSIGFRVARIPEPATGLLVTAGLAGLALRRHRSA